VYYSSVPHAHAHFACVISCKTRQSDNARHGDPAGIRKKQLVAFRSWDVVLFAAATSERFPDGTISDVISCRSPRWCGPAMPFPREARLCRISQAPLSCFWPVPGYEKKDLAKGRMMSSVAAAEGPDSPYLRHMCRVHGYSSLSTARGYGHGIGPTLDTCDPI
jgi:hypothetical protein